jgi:hypothetical protein
MRVDGEDLAQQATLNPLGDALLGRPLEVAAFLRTDSSAVPGFKDNTLVVCSYASALAFVDIAAIEPPPARGYQVYGEQSSAIME